jgi:hypothetical protein
LFFAVWQGSGLPVCRVSISFFEEDASVLELRPGCECCDKDLLPDSAEARICSFECTFCAACAQGVLRGRCPNCGGELVPRPRRPASELESNPPSSARVRKLGGCTQLA